MPELNIVEKVIALGPGYENHFHLIQPTDTKTPYPWTGILFGLTFVMANAYMIGNPLWGRTLDRVGVFTGMLVAVALGVPAGVAAALVVCHLMY